MTENRQAPLAVTLYGRPGCHLCDVMRAALLDVARRLPLTIQEVDISADPALTARYGNDVPVLVAGQTEIARHRATADELLDRLARQSRG